MWICSNQNEFKALEGNRAERFEGTARFTIPLQSKEGAFLPTHKLTPILLKCRSPWSLDNSFLHTPCEQQKGLQGSLLAHLCKAEKIGKPTGMGTPQYLQKHCPSKAGCLSPCERPSSFAPMATSHQAGQNYRGSWSLIIPNTVPAVLGTKKTPETITQVLFSPNYKSADSAGDEQCSWPASGGFHRKQG